MPESMLYSFDDTDALLCSLSNSTMSPADIHSSSSGNPSSNGASPENVLLNDIWASDPDLNYNDNEFLDLNTICKDNAPLDNVYVSPSSIRDAGSPLNSLQDKLEQTNISIKREQITPVSMQSSKQVKVEDDDDEDDDDDSDDDASPSSQNGKVKVSKNNKVGKPIKKDRSNHNIIEKKYRTNINTKINALRDAVPALRIAKGDTGMTIKDLDGLSPASKINKASVLAKATEYIKHLESKNASLVNELNQLRLMISQQPRNSYQDLEQQRQPQQQPQQQQQQQPQPVYQNYQQQQQPIQQQQFDSQFQPASDIYGNPINVVSQQPQYNIGVPGKILMGGLATMVGQNLYTGGNDFDYRGLSAFPILSGPQVQIFFNITKCLFVILSALYIFVPSVFYKTENADSKLKERTVSDWYQLAKQLAFIYAGDQPKTEPSDEEVESFITKEILTSKEYQGFFAYLFALLKLSTYKPSFEVSFGKLTLAKLLISYSDLSSYLKLHSLINDSLEEISKQKVTEATTRSFFKELKSTSAQSTEAFKRLLNISLNLPLGTNCQKGVSDKGYHLILKDETVAHNYRLLLSSFRANELFLEVLSRYIDFTFNENDHSDLDVEEIREFKKELWNKLKLAETLAPKRSIMEIRIKLFKSVLNDKYLDSVLKLINDEAHVIPPEQSVEFAVSTSEENDYEDEDEDDEDDDEDDESEGTLDEEGLEEEPEERGVLFHIDSSATLTTVNSKFQKLLTRDLFDTLVASSGLRYIHAKKHLETKNILRHLRASKDDITLLSFISLFNLVQKYPKEWLSGDEALALEKLVGTLRLWVGDSNNTSFADYTDGGLPLKREISDKLVQFGKTFSDFD